MTSSRRRLSLAIAVLALPMLAPRVLTQHAPKRAMELQDIIDWRNINTPVLSPDGAWFAYRLAPQEGDAEVVVRNTQGTNELRFPAGDAPLSAGGGRGDEAPRTLAFSDDSKFVAFTAWPTRADERRLKRQHRPVESRAVVVNVATGEKREYDRVRRFAFSGEDAGWIALHRYQPQPPGGAARGASADGDAGRGDTGRGAAGSEKPKGSDLLLVELASGNELNVGNVSEFAFRKDGRQLAYAIDAQDKAGNGIQLRDMRHGTVIPLDSGAATYENISWSDKGDALAVLKGTDDKAFRDKLYAVVGFTDIESAKPARIVYDPASDPAFPKGLTISPDREPQWTDDHQAVLFGIHEPRRKDPETESAEAAAPATGNSDEASADSDDKVDLVLWHYKDPRLQTQQEVQEARDRAYSYLSEYRVAEKKFIRLASDELRNVTVNPKSRWAFGTDDRQYELMGSLDGRRFADVYSIDLQSGAHRLLAKHLRYVWSASPDGSKLLYYDDGFYHVFSLASGDDRNITSGLPVSFVDVEDDHNEVKPPVPPIGWASDGAHVLLTDAWDVWNVPVVGGPAVNLTGNGKKDAIRYEQRFETEPPDDRDDGIDLSRPQFFRAYGEWTKKGGVARIDPGRPGARMLAWDDASYPSLMKARKADRYVYTHGTVTDPADYYITDTDFSQPVRLTDQRPAIDAFAWSPGVQIVNYTSDKGDKLQAALFLPANYEKGKSYPTMVYFYEKMSQTANTFAAPTVERLQSLLLHEQRVRRADARYHVSRQRSGHVGGLVHGAGRQGGHRDRHRRSEARRNHRPLMGRLPDGVPRDPDRRLRRRRRRRAADRHGQHVQPGLQEHRRGERRDLREQPGAVQGRLLGQLGRLLSQLADLLREERPYAAHDPAQRQGRRRGLHPGRRVLQHAPAARQAGHHARVPWREPRAAEARESARLHGQDEGVLRSLPEGCPGAGLDGQRRSAT